MNYLETNASKDSTYLRSPYLVLNNDFPRFWVFQNRELLFFIIVLISTIGFFPEFACADPFAAVAQKISSTTKGILKIGAVGCGLVGALLIIQGIFGRLNLKWGVSFVIAAILLASFDYVIDFITQP